MRTFLNSKKTLIGKFKLFFVCHFIIKMFCPLVFAWLFSDSNESDQGHQSKTSTSAPSLLLTIRTNPDRHQSPFFSRTAICGSTGSTKSFIVVIQTMLVANVSVHHQRTQTFCLTLTLANTHFFIALLVCVIEWCCDCVFSYSLCDCFFCVLFVRLWVFVGVIWSVGPVEQRSVSGTWWTEEGSGFGIKPHDLAAPSPWSKCHLLAETCFVPHHHRRVFGQHINANIVRCQPSTNNFLPTRTALKLKLMLLGTILAGNSIFPDPTHLPDKQN